MAGLNKVTVDDIDVKGKKVLVRVDSGCSPDHSEARFRRWQGNPLLSPRQAEEWPGSKVLSEGCCRTPCRTGCSDKGYFRTV